MPPTLIHWLPVGRGELRLSRAQRLTQVICRAQDLHSEPDDWVMEPPLPPAPSEGLGGQETREEPPHSQCARFTGAETKTEDRTNVPWCWGQEAVPGPRKVTDTDSERQSPRPRPAGTQTPDEAEFSGSHRPFV